MGLMFDKKFTVSELLQYSAVLCATDTVAVLNLVKEQQFPQLHSILFGEGIMNDAIAIVIFRSIKDQTSEIQPINIIFDFIWLFSMSVIIGMVIGFSISFLFKKFDSFNNFPLRETSIILLFAYSTYLISELLSLSGIISLFVCGIILGHYGFLNISEESQRGTVLAFESVAYLAEAFVFAYLGVSIYAMDFKKAPFLFSFLMILVIAFARFISVFSLPCFVALCRREHRLKMKELKVVWYSGLIRGAIAFALSLQIKSDNKEILVDSVLVIVIFTIVILSSMLASFQRHVGLSLSDGEEIINNLIIDKQKSENISRYNNIGSYELDSSLQEKNDGNKSNNINSINNQSPSKIKQKLTSFEMNYVRPIFTRDQQIQEINLMEMNNGQNK